jgi:MFS family permease
MKNPPSDGHVGRRFAPTALMLGNIVTGCSVLAPAGMLSELSSELDVTIRDAGLLITFGAIVLCVGSPLTAWLTSRIERRTLLTATLGVLALTNAAFPFAPDYVSLLVIRLIMLAVGALYTPQAAGTGALIVRGETRQHHRLHFSRLVARRRDRPAADHLHRQPLRLARGLRQYRPDRLFEFPVAGVAAAGWIGRLAG